MLATRNRGDRHAVIGEVRRGEATQDERRVSRDGTAATKLWS